MFPEHRSEQLGRLFQAWVCTDESWEYLVMVILKAQSLFFIAFSGLLFTRNVTLDAF